MSVDPSLSDLLNNEPSAQYADNYENYYFNLRNLINDMSSYGVEKDIADIDASHILQDDDVDIEKIRMWLKARCGGQAY